MSSTSLLKAAVCAGAVRASLSAGQMATKTAAVRMLSKSAVSAAHKSTEQTGKHDPYGEMGSGYYSLATRGCFDVIANARNDVMEAADKALHAYMQRKKHSDMVPFVIADYGTADGGTSMPLIDDVVKYVRSKAPAADVPVVVLYEDQAQNDFRSLFLRLHGFLEIPPSLMEGTDDAPRTSYLLAHDNVYAMASGTTFYEQVCPHNFVDLGFSATAMHWLTRLPQPIPDALHSACTQDASTKEAFAKQAAKDWLAVLSHRQNELKPGGRFVCVNFAVDEHGQFLGTTDRTPEKMHDNFAKLWRAMADEGRITESEFANTNFPNQYRTLEEVQRPFVNGDLPLLELDKSYTAVVPCPYRNKWLSDGGDAKQHARLYVPTTRTWSNSTFFSGLDNSRSDKEKNGLVDEMFSRYERLVANNPSDHGMDYVHTYTTFHKRA